jgi:D-glycero-D-manno-heptose 1,7-bisphosphate phosphatase
MPFILLDRDGVINFDSDEYIKSADEWVAIPGSLEAIAHLNRLGFRVLVVTNQSGISRGFFNLETLTDMHEKFIRELATVGGYIEEIFFCPHQPADHCQCRKPKPGLMKKIQERYAINLSETFYIGDNLSDIQFAQSVGCVPVLVLTGKGQRTLEKNPELRAILNFNDLADAVRYISVRI